MSSETRFLNTLKHWTCMIFKQYWTESRDCWIATQRKKIKSKLLILLIIERLQISSRALNISQQRIELHENFVFINSRRHFLICFKTWTKTRSRNFFATEWFNVICLTFVVVKMTTTSRIIRFMNKMKQSRNRGQRMTHFWTSFFRKNDQTDLYYSLEFSCCFQIYVFRTRCLYNRVHICHQFFY